MKFDTYSLKARVYPCLIVLLPIFLLAIIYVTNIKLYFHYITSFVSFGVFSFLLAQIGRDNGKLKEKELFEYWGGKPTSMILRHSNDYLDSHTKNRLHSRLTQTIPNIKIPTNEEEQENRQAADKIYDSCTKYLISKTRDSNKYHLLLNENINYGFRRNLWGMKTWALPIIFICMFILLLTATKTFTTIETINNGDYILFSIYTLLIMIWIFIIKKDWIKLPAFAYAERLFETLDEQI